MLDLENCCAKIPRLIGRLIPFSAFAVYCSRRSGSELRMAYAVGYPE